jgi:hypothetical protein
MIFSTYKFWNITLNNFTNDDLEEKRIFQLKISAINLILMVLGVIGNSLCVFVFSQSRMRKYKLNWYLLILAIFELLFCLLLSIDYVGKILLLKNVLFYELDSVIEKIFDLLIHTADCFIAIITIILSIDRFFTIKNRVKIKTCFTNLQRIVLVVSVSSVLVLIKILEFIICYQMKENNIFINYCGIISPIIFNIFPVLAVLVINLFLVKEIISYYRNDELTTNVSNTPRCSRSSNNMHVIYKNNYQFEHALIKNVRRFSRQTISNTEKSHFIIIIVLSVWLVLTTIPYYTINIYYTFLFRQQSIHQEDFNINTQIIYKMKSISSKQSISSIFLNSNHFINFFIYCFYYSMFRDCLFKLFRCVYDFDLKKRDSVRI